MNRFLEKIPKPVLVLVVLCLALGLFVYNDPLRDECDIQAKVFERNTRGILKGIMIKKKIQFAKIAPMRDMCKEGNSLGACAEYFQALRQVAEQLKAFKGTCQIKYAQKEQEENRDFAGQLGSAVQVMALVAWGEKPPSGPSERAGWLTEPDLRAFCELKKSYTLLTGDEGLTALRNRVYIEYPDEWSTSVVPKEGAEADLRSPEDRPRALKTGSNPTGHFDVKQIFERSLFSIRCDLYL